MVGQYFKEKTADEIFKIKATHRPERNKYVATYNYNWDNTELKRKTFSGNSAADCHAQIIKFQQNLIDGEAKTKKEIAEKKRQEITVGEACKLYLKNDVKGVTRDITLAGYCHEINYYIIPHLGDVMCKDLDYIKLEEWVGKLENHIGKYTKSGLSYRTVHGAKNLLAKIMDYIIIRERLMIRNPCDDKGIARKIKGKFADASKQKVHDERGNLVLKSELKSLSTEDVKHFVQYIYENNLRFAPSFLLSVCYGLRPGESVGVKFGDVNITERTLAVQRDINRVGDSYDADKLLVTNSKLREDKTKSINSERTIFLSEAMIEVLEYHKKVIELERKHYLYGGRGKRRYNENDYVCSTRYGTIMDTRNSARCFYDVMENLGINGKTPHNLRATYATMMRNEVGIDKETIAWLMGHSTEITVTDLYIGKRLEYARKVFEERIKPYTEKIEQIAIQEIRKHEARGIRRY